MDTLIERNQSYLLERKIITIHSEDRDVAKYPKSNVFAVRLPEDIANVQSVRLMSCVFPSFQYVFSREYQNTKLTFEVIGNISIDGDATERTVLETPVILTIEIEEGFYTPPLLAIEFENKLNAAMTEYLKDQGLTELSNETAVPYTKFSVKYNEVQHKLIFGNRRDPFAIYANRQEEYVLSCGQKLVWEQPEKWGLPDYIGFNKVEYRAVASETASITYEMPPLWMTPTNDASNLSVWTITPPNMLNIMGEHAFYMELDGHNTIQELAPFPSRTSAATGSTYAGGNYAFAKIPLTQMAFSVNYDSVNGYLSNITFYKRPLERLRDIKVKIRTHDGRLVDFRNIPYTFTLEFVCLNDEVRGTASHRPHHIYNA
jgi:hypothetical protein